MNAGNISESLTKKLGPLPVFAWALIAGVILYMIRGRGNTGGSSSADRTAASKAEADLVTAEGNARAQNLQNPQILAPGESVFDPNTQSLLTPSPNNGDLNTSLVGLIGALAMPQPAPAVPSPSPQTAKPTVKAKPRPKPTTKPKPPPKTKAKPSREAEKGKADTGKDKNEKGG